MARYSIPEIVPLKAPQGVHFLLAWGIPGIFSALIVFWLTGQGPGWPWFPLGATYAALLVFWTTWRSHTHQGPLLKLWTWIIVTLALFGGCAWAEGLPWPRTFSLEGYHTLWFFLCFAQGQLAALWAGQLVSRARLFQLVQGVPEGKVLEERVRDFQLDADFSQANHNNLASSLAVLGALAVVGASVSPYGRNGLSAWLLLGFLSLCLLVSVLLRTYRREAEALIYGRRFTLADKLAPLGWSLLLLCLAALGAWAAQGLGGPWFDWNTIFQGQIQPPPPDLPASIPKPPLPESGNGGDLKLTILIALLLRIFRFQNILLLVEAVVQLGLWGAVVAVAAFLVWPLARWFLTGGRETRGLGRRWLSLWKDQWASFRQAIAAWWQGSQADPRGVSLGSGTARQWLRSLLTRPAFGSRRPYPEVVTAFLSLVKWAELVAPYHRGETTREYLDRVACLLPAHSSTLAQVRDLLDKELFAPRGLDVAGRKAFLDLVSTLVSQPPAGVS